MMINLDDIAALPHGEGKAVAITLWNRLQIVGKAFHMMAAEFDYSELKRSTHSFHAMCHLSTGRRCNEDAT